MTLEASIGAKQSEPTAGPWSSVTADLRRYGDSVSAVAFMRTFCLVPGFRYMFWMRLAEASRRSGNAGRALHYLFRWRLHRCGIRYGIAIPYNTKIGPGFYIGHYGGIVVSKDAVIGRDCNINHGVTIGAKYGGKHPGTPVIGDRVYLGPGCVVIGAVRLADGVAVGANAVVVDSVPTGGVVGGVPARLISRRGSGDYIAHPSMPQPARGLPETD